MRRHDKTFETIVTAAAKVCDGTIDAGELETMENLLHENKAARLLFVEYLDLHASLTAPTHHDVYGRPWELIDALVQDQRSLSDSDDGLLSEVLEQESQAAARRAAQQAMLKARLQAERASSQSMYERLLAADVSSPPVRHIVIPRVVAYGMLAAMVALVAYALFRPLVPLPPTPAPGPVPTTVATLVRAIDARWDNAQMPTTPQSPLPAGPLRLVEGLVEINFASGATVILQAPAELELVSRDRARLTHGKLVGEVPPEARGFTVIAPNATVIDLGTEFGIDVDRAGMAHVEVFTGEVALSTPFKDRDASAHAVKAGGAVTVNAQGQVNPTTATPFAFVRRDELDAHQLARDGSAYHRWLLASYELSRRDDLLAYYPFDAESRRQDTLLNRAGRTADRLHGRLGDGVDPATRPQWDAGRFPNKAALLFDPDHLQRVIVSHDPVFTNTRQLTIFYWIRVYTSDELPRTVVSKRAEHVEFQSAIYPDTHSIQFATAPTPVGAVEGLYETRSIPPSMNWQMIAITYDGRVARFYRNGELVDMAQLAYPIAHTTADIWIGAVDHVHAYPDDTDSQRFGFSGSIDELAIIASVLDAATIRAIYEAGRPD